MTRLPTHRLGVLVPSSNTTVEIELHDALPRDISLHVGRLPLTRIAAESIVEIVRPLEEESKELATADVDLMPYPCHLCETATPGVSPRWRSPRTERRR